MGKRLVCVFTPERVYVEGVFIGSITDAKRGFDPLPDGTKMALRWH